MYFMHTASEHCKGNVQWQQGYHVFLTCCASEDCKDGVQTKRAFVYLPRSTFTFRAKSMCRRNKGAQHFFGECTHARSEHTKKEQTQCAPPTGD